MVVQIAECRGVSHAGQHGIDAATWAQSRQVVIDPLPDFIGGEHRLHRVPEFADQPDALIKQKRIVAGVQSKGAIAERVHGNALKDGVTNNPLRICLLFYESPQRGPCSVVEGFNY